MRRRQVYAMLAQQNKESQASLPPCEPGPAENDDRSSPPVSLSEIEEGLRMAEEARASLTIPKRRGRPPKVKYG